MPHRPRTAMDAVDDSPAAGRHVHGLTLIAPPMLFILYGSFILKAAQLFFPGQPLHRDILLLILLTATACTHMTVLLGQGLRDALRPAADEEPMPAPDRRSRWRERHEDTQHRIEAMWTAFMWRNYRLTLYAIYLLGSGGALYFSLLRTLDP